MAIITLNNNSLSGVTALPAGVVDANALASGVGGSMTLLQTTNASNVASVTIGSSSLLDSTYKAYKIIGSNIVPTTDGTAGHARVSISNTIQTSAQYSRCRIRMYDGSASVSGYVSNASDVTMVNFLGESIGSNTGESINFESIVFEPSSSNYKHFLVNTAGYDLSPNSQFQTMAFVYKGSTSAIDGVQFYFASGNIESGTFKLYGLG
jgi:hypothetical protein